MYLLLAYNKIGYIVNKPSLQFTFADTSQRLDEAMLDIQTVKNDLDGKSVICLV